MCDTFMTRWRRIKGSDTWHWCENCSNYPESDFEELTKKPLSGKFDDECELLEKEKKCLKRMFNM